MSTGSSNCSDSRRPLALWPLRGCSRITGQADQAAGRICLLNMKRFTSILLSMNILRNIRRQSVVVLTVNCFNRNKQKLLNKFE